LDFGYSDKKYLNAVNPITKNYDAWQAFLTVINWEIKLLAAKLQFPLQSDELVRINAQISLLHRLTQLRDTILQVEKNYDYSSSKSV
jgi:hypothetical protein